MSGEPLRTKNAFIQPPIEGVNYIAPATAFLETEARQLDNYFIFDWGIRERGEFTFEPLPDGGIPIGAREFTSGTIRGLLVCSQSHTYIYDGNLFSVSLGNNSFTTAFLFNKVVFMPLINTAQVATFNLNTDTYAATSFTIPPGFTTNIGWVFKDRVFLIDDNTSTFRYGAPGAITGALSAAYDVGQFFQRGKYLLWGTSWSYNSGQTNEELMVVGNDVGEIFVFSGDGPESDNWQMISRIDIPTPLVRQYYSVTLSVNQPASVLKMGQDVLVNTTRGVLSLAQVMAGRQDDQRYYSISRKLGPIISGASAAKSIGYPFAYFSDNNNVYALNYERGAWSRFPGLGSRTFPAQTVTQIVCSSRKLAGNYENPLPSYVYVMMSGDAFGANAGFYKLNEAAQAADSTGYGIFVWETPFFDFGTKKKKKSNLLRIIGRVTGGDTLSNTVTMKTEFNDTVDSGYSTRTDVVTDGSYRVQELNPVGNGTYLSYKFRKEGIPDQQNEIAGFAAYFEEGGDY